SGSPPPDRGARPVRAGRGPCAGRPDGGRADRPPGSKHETREMRNRFGRLEPFVPEGTALSEGAQLGMAGGEAGTGLHGGQEALPEALAARRTVEEGYGLPEAVDRLTIITLELVGSAEAQVGQRMQDDLPASRRERQGALGSGDGLVIRPHDVEIV